MTNTFDLKKFLIENKLTPNSALQPSGRDYTNLEDLGEDDLRANLSTWSRESLRDWLMTNDRNGVYSDEDSIREFGDVLSKEDAIDTIVGQISAGRGYLEEENIEEGVWAGMMKGVRAGESGPWSIVAINGGRVVGQSNNIKIQDLIPAKYEALKREFPNARIHIEDAGGQVVWNAPLKEEVLTAREKKLVEIAQAILENKGLKLVHAYDKDGKLYGTGESVETKGEKTLVKFDANTEKWFDSKDVKLVK